MPRHSLNIICAAALNRAIGYRGELLYHLRADLRRFKALTTGHTVIMGRKTFDSLPKGALPNRRNIVLSRNPEFKAENVEVFPSLPEALSHCSEEEELFIMGGESVYAEAFPISTRLYLTRVEAVPEKADAFFPEFDESEWQAVAEEHHEADEQNAVPYTFVDYVRR